MNFIFVCHTDDYGVKKQCWGWLMQPIRYYYFILHIILAQLTDTSSAMIEKARVKYAQMCAEC